MSIQSYSGAPARNSARSATIPSAVALKSGSRLGPAKPAAPAATGKSVAGFKSAGLKPGFVKI